MTDAYGVGWFLYLDIHVSIDIDVSIGIGVSLDIGMHMICITLMCTELQLYYD